MDEIPFEVESSLIHRHYSLVFKYHQNLGTKYHFESLFPIFPLNSLYCGYNNLPPIQSFSLKPLESICKLLVIVYYKVFDS